LKTKPQILPVDTQSDRSLLSNVLHPNVTLPTFRPHRQWSFSDIWLFMLQKIDEHRFEQGFITHVLTAT
jgi:hypothetical protein